MKETMQEIPEALLGVICGGTGEEIDELREFIEAHDKDWKFNNVGDIGTWLVLNADLAVAQLMYQEENGYKGTAGSISHKELMAELKKQFS